jgi:hypothetical protein
MAPATLSLTLTVLERARCSSWPASDGTPKQKADFRRQRFFRALGWAEDQELIGTGEIGGGLVDDYSIMSLPKTPSI